MQDRLDCERRTHECPYRADAAAATEVLQRVDAEEGPRLPGHARRSRCDLVDITAAGGSPGRSQHSKPETHRRGARVDTAHLTLDSGSRSLRRLERPGQ